MQNKFSLLPSETGIANKWIVIIGTVITVGAFLGWLFVESSKPLPGGKIADEGRDHVDIGTEIKYGTNPPTSGKHYADWIRAGIYPDPKDDRNLVHSLEHGYVIMSYNCDEKISLIPQAFAQESSQSAESTSSSGLSSEFQSEDCKKLVEQLTGILDKKGKKKLIVIPRPNMDSRVALTAWTYLDKFDPSTSGLNQTDIDRIEKFIDSHLNQGPELTVE